MTAEGAEARRGKDALSLSGGHLCHVCGHQYPNPNPSAKLRRSHRKNCSRKPAAAASGDRNVAERPRVLGTLLVLFRVWWFWIPWFLTRCAVRLPSAALQVVVVAREGSETGRGVVMARPAGAPRRPDLRKGAAIRRRTRRTQVCSISMTPPLASIFYPAISAHCRISRYCADLLLLVAASWSRDQQKLGCGSFL
jgi:hypothetical protein